VLLPNPVLSRRVRALAAELAVDLVMLDPAVPLGAIGPGLGVPYGVVLHGAEVTIPGRVPGLSAVLGRVLRRAELVICAGGYPAAEAERCAGVTLPTVVIPPGVDTDRFTPSHPAERSAARQRYGLDDDDLLVTSISRLVPRKGMDTLIRAAAALRLRQPALRLLIGGRGRDEARLRRLIASTGAPAELVGFVAEEDIPAFYGCADVFAMLCRARWGGLEQEGFGIVFAEAAACGVPTVCGRSGGAEEAVEHRVTGLVVDRPSSVQATARALDDLLADARRRRVYGAAGRERAVAMFDYDRLADRLHGALADWAAGRPPGSGIATPICKPDHVDD
jgi:phosphatidylinositol alpha-1,6-mannosyltransferase